MHITIKLLAITASAQLIKISCKSIIIKSIEKRSKVRLSYIKRLRCRRSSKLASYSDILL
jgi:hypothetical protein